MRTVTTAATKPTMHRGDVAGEWRMAQGSYVRGLREARGLSQQEVADALDVNNKQFISHIETGRVNVPPQQFKRLADVLKVDRKEFVQTLLRYQNPWAYEVLFGADAALRAELARAAAPAKGPSGRP